MNKLELKKAIAEAATNQLEELLFELKETAQMKLQASGEDDDSIVSGSFGSGDSGNEDMSKEAAAIILAEAENVKVNIQAFKNFRFEKEHNSVSLLSLLETDKGNFFISRAVKPVTLNGTRYFLLATSAPIYEAMQGKKKGESYTFNNITYTIKDLY